MEYIYVKKEFRKNGIAKLLLSNLYNKATTLSVFNILIEVRSNNQAAINLYEKENFEKIHIRKNYYSSPIDDAIIYRKQAF